jgi:hypothetical protein
MANFPNTFAEKLQYLPADLGEDGNAARERLAEKGFVVVAGLTRHMAGAVSAAASQEHIVEVCPKDPTEKRFGTEESTEKWLGKGGGRGVMLMAKPVGKGALEMAMAEDPVALKKLRMVAYSWEGGEKSEIIAATGTEVDTTFAIRMTQEGLGHKASADFTTVTVAGSAALYGAQNVWLETYGWNIPANKAYKQAGFEQVTTPDGSPLEVPTIRPTLHEAGYEFEDGSNRRVFMHQGENDPAPRPYVEDTRLYYTFPNDRLPQLAAA